MKTFIATNNQEKFIKKAFGSKANAIRNCNISRPTIDRMCRDRKYFYKHLTLLSESTGIDVKDIILFVENGI